MSINTFIMLKMTRKILITFIISLFVTTWAYPQGQISRIDIKGNNIVSDATIISKIKVRAGQPYNENVINNDVKNLYATGFFETVKVEKSKDEEATVVTFKVKEKKVLKDLKIEGARYIREKNIRGAIDLKEGSFVDDYRIKETVRKIKNLYSEKGFTQAEVGYELIPIADKDQVNITLTINEKGILKVRDVYVEGNENVSDKRIIKLMKTRRAWLFNKGIFKKEVLEDDLRRIRDFYKLEGFSDVVVDADIEYKPKGVYITVNTNEGKLYRVGDVNIEGNEEVSTKEILEVIKLNQGSVFSEQVAYEDSSRIREIYVDRGYIFTQVEPNSVFNSQTGKIDITFEITESEVAYIEDIHIKGNIKTKDKVIRRELRMYPGERFDGKKVRKSKEELENLGFFEEIRVGTEPGTKPENIDLVIDVKEAKTGYFSFGGGYSSIDEFIGFVELRQRNFDYKNWKTFTGAGQDLSLLFSLGTLTDRYQLSFTNPWIFDTPITFGFDAYKKGHKRDDDVGYAYEQEITGGALRLGRELGDYWRIGTAYRYERVEISDVIDTATSELKSETGINNLSSGELSLAYDSRDNVFSPSKGMYIQNIFHTFGGPFGGDRDFIKYFGRVSFYFPLINKSVIELKARGGYADPYSSTSKVPIYERFFAGGASTIRGYQERKVGPIDSATEDPIGGEAMFVGNIEYTYPLADFLKVATFYDVGNVWKKNDGFFSSEEGRESLYSSIGIGLRVKTPIGPVSVDYGWPLDLEPGEESKEGRFHFNVSRGF